MINELLKELEYNRDINMVKGLPNVVDIDYIIDRLKHIDIASEYFRGEIYFNIENMINDDYLSEETKEKLVKLENEDIQGIVENLLYDDYRNEKLNADIQYELNKLIENDNK